VVPWQIAAKFCVILGSMFCFITLVQKFGGLSPQKIGGEKHANFSPDFRLFSTLSANIFGTDRDIQNRKNYFTHSVSFRVGRKKFGELWYTNYGDL